MKFIQQLLLTMLTLLCLCSCSDEKSGENTITVAVSADNPPYEFIQDGKIVGLDIDVINAIGTELGKKIVIKNLDFPGLLPALSTNNVDLVISAISVTEDRKRHFDFSDIYATSEMSLLHRIIDGFKSIDDLKGKTIGAQLGSTWEQEARARAQNLPGTLVHSLANNLVLVEELKSGSIDAIILEKMQVLRFIENNKALTSFKIPGASSDFAIVLSQDSELKDPINKAIANLRAKGKLTAIQKHWTQ